MRILINGLFLIPNRVGGSETYLRCLLDALCRVDTDNDYILCVGPEAAGTFPNWSGRIVVSPLRSTWRPGRLALEQTWLPRVANVLLADVIHSAGYTAPLASRARRVTNIHDMNYKRHPEDLSLAERLVYATLIPRGARRSRRVLALTEAARNDIVRWTHVAPSKVVVAYAAARATWPGDPRDDVERIQAAGVREPFVLSVAAAYPHKNLGRLVRAMPDVSLVIVGLKGRATPELLAASRGREGLVNVLGWVDDALLASLYRRSAVLAFPSLYEGFGLPILEAMALGTPVVTSRMGAMAEVAGDAAQLVDPYDVSSIRNGLAQVLGDARLRQDLRARGLQRAADFSWTNTAQLTLEAYAAAVRRA